MPAPAGRNGFSSNPSKMPAGGFATTGGAALTLLAAMPIGADAPVLTGPTTVAVAAFADAAAVDVAAALDAVPSFPRSLMFLAISAARSALSLALRSFASLSSAVTFSMAAFDKVNLSGAAAMDFFSSTRASIAPAASRSVTINGVSGAASASFRRNSLKSLLCATINCAAWAAGVLAACSAVGILRMLPALIRLTLSPMNDAGLVRNSATSI